MLSRISYGVASWRRRIDGVKLPCPLAEAARATSHESDHPDAVCGRPVLASTAL